MTKRHLTDGHRYFTVEETAAVIQKRGALAIYCGDAPRRDDEEGTTIHPLRAPLLIMPPDMFSEPEETLAKVAAVLNENAGCFFSSAHVLNASEEQEQPKRRAGPIAETLIRIKDRLTDRAERDAINEAVAALYARERANEAHGEEANEAGAA